MTVDKPFADSATPLLHSRIHLPIPQVPMHAFVGDEEYECLWARVNHICDRYMVPAADVRWRTKGSRTIIGKMARLLSTDCLFLDSEHFSR